MPFMINFRPVYLPAYFVGSGLSALVPSVVAMVQGKYKSGNLGIKIEILLLVLKL